MNRGRRIVGDMIRLFTDNCEEKSTMVVLSALLQNQSAWGEGYQLFQSIRAKTLQAADAAYELLYGSESKAGV
jgi:hypothetical protein